MNWKRIIIDPSFWLLIIINIVLIYNYKENAQIFGTLISLYWSQNILYGIFNYFNIITSIKEKETSFDSLQDSNFPGKGVKAGCSFFYLTQFGFFFFHFAYLIFIVNFLKKSGPFQWGFYTKYLLIFFIWQLINFIFHKIYQRGKTINVNNASLLPFLRVVPMHLCILIPAFLNVTDLTVFLVMKMIADVSMYIITNTNYKIVSLTESTSHIKIA